MPSSCKVVKRKAWLNLIKFIDRDAMSRKQSAIILASGNFRIIKNTVDLTGLTTRSGCVQIQLAGKPEWIVCSVNRTVRKYIRILKSVEKRSFIGFDIRTDVNM